MVIRPLHLALSAAFAACAATVFLAPVAWDAGSAALRRELDQTAVVPPAVFSSDDLTDSPEPVGRFFRRVLKEGQRIIRAVDLRTEGEFQTGTDDRGWRSFTASQRFATAPPGFVWDARIRMAPLLPVYVRDAYVGARTEMRGKVLALYPVVDEADTPALAAGQLHRYLGETMWFPTALLPGSGVVWTAVDHRSALATLTDRGTTVSLRFTFTDEGDITEIFAPDRMRSVDGRNEPTPWTVRCSDHQERQGIRIPLWCVAEWVLPEGPLPYWRGRVADVRYEFR